MCENRERCMMSLTGVLCVCMRWNGKKSYSFLHHRYAMLLLKGYLESEQGEVYAFYIHIFLNVWKSFPFLHISHMSYYAAQQVLPFYFQFFCQTFCVFSLSFLTATGKFFLYFILAGSLRVLQSFFLSVVFHQQFQKELCYLSNSQQSNHIFSFFLPFYHFVLSGLSSRIEYTQFSSRIEADKDEESQKGRWRGESGGDDDGNSLEAKEDVKSKQISFFPSYSIF